MIKVHEYMTPEMWEGWLADIKERNSPISTTVVIQIDDEIAEAEYPGLTVEETLFVLKHSLRTGGRVENGKIYLPPISTEGYSMTQEEWDAEYGELA